MNKKSKIIIITNTATGATVMRVPAEIRDDGTIWGNPHSNPCPILLLSHLPDAAKLKQKYLAAVKTGNLATIAPEHIARLGQTGPFLVETAETHEARMRPLWKAETEQRERDKGGQTKTYHITVKINGREWVFVDRNVFDFGRCVNPAYSIAPGHEPGGKDTMRRKRQAPPEKPHELDILQMLTTPAQFEAITDGLLSEEGDHFVEVIDRIHAAWQAMPKTYETDGQGRAALARLHYFTGGCDWWIVERDADPDGAGQVQAFGIADLGMGRKLGYISIPELLENGAELDLYYTEPKTIGELLDIGYISTP